MNTKENVYHLEWEEIHCSPLPGHREEMILFRCRLGSGWLVYTKVESDEFSKIFFVNDPNGTWYIHHQRYGGGAD